MTSESQIAEQIQNDYNRFWNSPYEGKLPSDIMYKFRSALMFHNTQSLQGSPTIIKELVGAQEYDLKFVHVGIMLNTMFAVPFNCMYDSPEEAMDAVIECKGIEVEYNKLVQKRTQEIERKRARLLELSGITKDTVIMNGAALKPIK